MNHAANDIAHHERHEANPCARAAWAAVRAIPPAWPLGSAVAVNPYLGQAGETLAQAGARLSRVAGLRVTMARHWYRERIASGRMTDADLEAARLAAPALLRPRSLGHLKACVRQQPEVPRAIPTVADLAASSLGMDVPWLVAERIGCWAAGHFDGGQAFWALSSAPDTFASWREFAVRDRTPGVLGLAGCRQHFAQLPNTALSVIDRAVARLSLPAEALETYFHALLMSLGGWAQLARHALWQAELEGRSDTGAFDLLAIRLAWEEALFGRCHRDIEADWCAARLRHAQPLQPSADQVVDAILQEAAERAEQRSLAEVLAAPGSVAVPQRPQRPRLQAIFCIDVRSEVFRRALEAVEPRIRTSGFAGFFGLPVGHRRLAADSDERRLPVLLTPTLHSRAAATPEQDVATRCKRYAKRAWQRFKLGAVSSFAFVEAMGPVYVTRLLRDALGLAQPKRWADPAPVLDPLPELEERVRATETVLRAMSLQDDFAELVLLVGHGASVANNPFASALDCGACGGHSGEVNARLLAGLLNDRNVRQGLAGRGIDIPPDTLFVAALHDTTTDRVRLFDQDLPAPDHAATIDRARAWLERAGSAARAERRTRLPRADSDTAILRRSRDWAEVRPEWGLAGCKDFIAAPRRRTVGKRLEGRAFLHDYDWREDADFGVLELILTAPVVVASWISLQYYGSTVSPEAFGSGNKLIHNATGGVGVVEGNGGLLRVGLPWQSIHDGDRYVHEPLRLSVCIEAPREAITGVLERHPGVRALFDNRWLHLFALDQTGAMAWRYSPGLDWEPVRQEEAVATALRA